MFVLCKEYPLPVHIPIFFGKWCFLAVILNRCLFWSTQLILPSSKNIYSMFWYHSVWTLEITLVWYYKKNSQLLTLLVSACLVCTSVVLHCGVDSILLGLQTFSSLKGAFLTLCMDDIFVALEGTSTQGPLFLRSTSPESFLSQATSRLWQTGLLKSKNYSVYSICLLVLCYLEVRRVEKYPVFLRLFLFLCFRGLGVGVFSCPGQDFSNATHGTSRHPRYISGPQILRWRRFGWSSQICMGPRESPLLQEVLSFMHDRYLTECHQLEVLDEDRFDVKPILDSIIVPLMYEKYDRQEPLECGAKTDMYMCIVETDTPSQTPPPKAALGQKTLIETKGWDIEFVVFFEVWFFKDQVFHCVVTVLFGPNVWHCFAINTEKDYHKLRFCFWSHFRCCYKKSSAQQWSPKFHFDFCFSLSQCALLAPKYTKRSISMDMTEVPLNTVSEGFLVLVSFFISSSLSEQTTQAILWPYLW